MRRRFFLLLSANLVGAVSLALPFRLLAQQQTRPKPPGNLRVIDGQDYNQWLQSMRKAADDLAEESNSRIEDEEEKKVDSEARKTLLEKGYKVPMPPMDLTAS